MDDIATLPEGPGADPCRYAGVAAGGPGIAGGQAVEQFLGVADRAQQLALVDVLED